jgi:beta-glucosidase
MQRNVFLSKLMVLFASLITIHSASMAQTNGDQSVPQLGKAPIKDVIAAMTLEEKAKLVVGAGMRFGPPNAQRRDSTRRDSTNQQPTTPQAPVVGSTQQRVPGAAGTTYAIPRLGIPSIVVADGPAGVRISPFRNRDSSRSYYATAFPVATLLASSWDTALVKTVGKAMGHEVKEYGIDILLAPALNIHRNPLGGRNFEYYSEDPLVAGSMTTAMVNGIESNGVGTSIKHFAANNQERNRNTVNTIASERALREIYLRGFEIAVKKAQPWTVMSSYNKINGTYTSENPELLTTILRDEWGFKGFVMTDWFGGRDPIAQMNAGNDLLMPGTPQQVQRIIDAVNHDSLDVKVLDRNIEHILNVILLSPSFKGYKYSDKPDLKADAAVARAAASEGMVLLKNNSNTLPLKNIKKVALFGNTSYDFISGGTGSGDVNEAYTISLVQGLQNAGYSISEDLANAYNAYLTEAKAKRPRRQGFLVPPPIPEASLVPTQISDQAQSADMAIITIGRNAGEGADRKVENDFNLSLEETDLIRNVAEAFHAKGKKVVAVLNTGGVVEVASWRDQVDAILLAWQPGLEAGNAVADVLSGKVNPSGKLATTFPMTYNDEPSGKNFPGKEFSDQATGTGFMRSVPAEVTYEEGIYVGYRYYSTFGLKPAYEFGYGLSYTNFSYGNLKLSSPIFKDKIEATITVTNNGPVAGKEVVQLYLSAPAKTLDKPVKELKAFGKTGLLKPGQSQVIRFELSPKDLASFDTNRSAWIAEVGAYKVSIGASSENIKQTASFQLQKELVVEKVHKVLTPKTTINEMKKPV